mmetsp:Transcript_74470/g.136272  ORF Transcript_74470/g.136272 Transcript_74470/m.136272 type:complete len:682 (-) Transcript_74470:62-2107(-)
MKSGLFLAALALSASGAVVSAARDQSQVTPVQKVLQLLEGMLAKGKAEKHDEEVQYASYKQFCDDTSTEKTRAIKEAEEKIESLKADIQFAAATAAQLTKEIAEHDADMSVWNGDISAATKVREIEHTDYETTHQDYTESIDALQRAIAVLKKQAYDRTQAESLAQVAALKGVRLIPATAKKAIESFLSQGDDESADADSVSGAPEANAYEFQSSSIIDMLEKLLDKFIDKRTTLQKEEMNAKHAFDMLVQDLKAQIDQADSSSKDKSENKAATLQSKATAEGDLTDTTATKNEDSKYLSDLTATCTQKASDFESRQELRAEEIVAIEKAIEILSSAAVSGAATKYLPSSLAQKKSSALVQLRADGHPEGQKFVAQFLQNKAQQLNSRVLAAVAARAAEDPFAKVKKMIKDLIVKLMEEATAEVEHKGWCDTELATNEQTRQEKTESVETLTAEIDQLEASIAKLSEDITTLTEEVANLDAAMAEATKLRAEEKAKNTVTISDAKEAQVAVAQALTVLNEFYAKASEATAFIQGRTHQEPPPIFDSPYKGLTGESGGVVSMLEVIESDFARLESDTEASEASALKEYDTFMGDSKADKAEHITEIGNKSEKKQDEEQTLVAKKKDVEGTQKELTAALEYFDKLKPSCIDAGVSFKDRTERRREEIESLQEALKILNGEDLR